MNFFSAFMKQVLDWIFVFVGNYGWSVVLFTLLVRGILLPLDIKSKRSMARMQQFQPQIDALQKKYKSDKEKLNQKMSDLYKKEKINPMSGCLPMLIQMPILFCMFTAMRVVANEQTVQLLLDMMNGAEYTFQNWLWIKNVYQPDSFMATIIPAIGDQLSAIQPVAGTLLSEENLTLVRNFLNSPEYAVIAQQYGATEFVYQAPILMWTIQIPAQFNGLFILPLLAGASQFISSKYMTQNQQQSSEQANQTNKMMQWFFPLFSIFICATSTAAFSIYWVAINIIQIVQQLVLNRLFKNKGTGPKNSEEVIVH